MFIQDIEFIDPLSQKDRRSNFSIRGGASAIAKTYTSTNDGEVYAKAYAKGTGNYSSSAVNTKVKLVNYTSSKGYVAGYSVGYGVAYGVDPYDSLSKDVSTSFSHL